MPPLETRVDSQHLQETSWPIFGGDEEKLLMEVFRSGNWWYGEKVAQFEKQFADLHDAKHGITCTNGTVALKVALNAAGVGPGDEVIVPDYTFIATAIAVVSIGAVPRFADVEPISANIDLDSAAALVNEHTKAIIIVHFAGLPVDMEKAKAFAKRHDLALIEDAAHSWGSQWNGKGVGAQGDLGTFSFQMSKNITSGEGGIILTNDDELARVARSYTNCGRLPEHEWYEHFILGGNQRMTELQAALLIAQTDRLLEHVERREENAAFLDKELSRIPGISVPERDNRVTRRSYHIYVVNYDSSHFSDINKDAFIKALNSEGVSATVGYLWPVHKNVAFQTLNDSPRPENKWLSALCNSRGIRFDRVDCPNASKLCNESMIWLTHMLLLGSMDDMKQVVEAFKKVHASA